MSWYDTSWRFRAPVAINNLSGASPIDISFVIPTDHPFWDDVLSSGNDIRVTDADGRNVLAYQLATWTHASKAGVIEVDGYTPPDADSMCLIWIYWGNAGAAAASGSFTASSAKTGTMDPISVPRQNVFTVSPNSPGATQPQNVITKGTAETVFAWLDFSSYLIKRPVQFGGSNFGEEIDSVAFQVFYGVSDETGVYDETQTRFYHPALVRLQLQAGTDGRDYTVSATVKLTSGRVVNPRILLKVKNVNES
jgi:hypothetical protein